MLNILIILTSLGISSFATPTLPNGACNFSGGQVKMDNGSVTFNGEKFPLDKETVMKAYATSVSGFMGGNGTQCRAETHLATVAKNGDIVLLILHRSKESHFGGLFCGLSVDVSKFDNPYYYDQIVISKDSTGQMTVKKLEVTDAIDRPDLKTEDLKNPNATTENPALKKFIDSENGQRNQRAILTNEVCGTPSSTAPTEPSAIR